ncbi:hypothetical protein GCM10022631_29440 [Deinococcus rubellus]|uniref:Flagellar hook-length control protein FliK n=1 Tax=Deinococcus rubellus TaxID=1889240 RepID=A0ABY5YEZ4_9DEIO|nr:hypothetical protein [Deinococcus rubellus]UWX63415.1 hypothetical protein N0D28_11750 [Deinococcus rubellus]
MDAVSARVHHNCMTFTLPRFGRRSITTESVQPSTPSVTAAPSALTEDVLMEVVLPEGRALPQVDGWTLRLWPQARLGDATLQAHPQNAAATLADLNAALHAQGVMTLGLVRRRAA